MTNRPDRLFKINTIIGIIESANQAGKIAKKDVLSSECSRLWGTSHRTFLEYLTVLGYQKEIYVNGNEIWTYDRWVLEGQPQKHLESEVNPPEDNDGKNQRTSELGCDQADSRPADSGAD